MMGFCKSGDRARLSNMLGEVKYTRSEEAADFTTSKREMIKLAI